MIFVSKVYDDDTVEIIDTSDGVKERISNESAVKFSSERVILGISDGVVSEYPLEEVINTGVATQTIKHGKAPYKCEGTTITKGKWILEDGAEVDVVYGVAHIGNNTFENQLCISTFDLPVTLLSIGDEAFSNCRGIREITLPDGIKSIGNDAFAHCVRLDEITIPDSVTELGISALAKCENLKRVTLSKNLTVIKSRTFSSCKQLTEIAIPDGVKKIEDFAFENCSNLKKVTIPDSVISIQDTVFKGIFKTNPTIYCSRNSYAAEFAKKKWLPCVYV